MNDLTLFWLIIACIFLLIELGAPGLFYFLSFFCGSLCAALSSYFCMSLIDQGALFLITSIICFFILKRWVAKYGSRSHYHSNMYALQGKQGLIVTPPTTQKFGYVYIDGELWACKARDHAVEAGQIVQVVTVQGAHVVVVAKVEHSH